MSEYITKTYGTGRVIERDGNVRDMTADEGAVYAKHLAQSLNQCKEIIAADLIPRPFKPFWLTPDPRGGFHERKRLRIATALSTRLP